MKKVLTILLAVSLVLLCGCGTPGLFLSTLKGNGDTAANVTALSDGVYTLKISGITLVGTALLSNNLVLDDTLDDAVVVTTDKNIYNDMKVTVDEAARSITISGSNTKKYNTNSLIIQVGVPLSEVTINGGLQVKASITKQAKVAYIINGAVKGSVQANGVQQLSMKINGAAQLDMGGTCENCVIDINGATNIKAYELVTAKSDLTISGAGNCEIFVTDTLTAKIEGLGSVTYKGDPAKVIPRTSGLGSVKPAE